MKQYQYQCTQYRLTTSHITITKRSYIKTVLFKTTAENWKSILVPYNSSCISSSPLHPSTNLTTYSHHQYHPHRGIYMTHISFPTQTSLNPPPLNSHFYDDRFLILCKPHFPHPTPVPKFPMSPPLYIVPHNPLLIPPYPP